MKLDQSSALVQLAAGGAAAAAAAAVAAAAAASGNGAAASTVVGRSRVVHLRNVPPDLTDVELIHLCIPFGKITNFLLLKSKNQVSECVRLLVSSTSHCLFIISCAYFLQNCLF